MTDTQASPETTEGLEPCPFCGERLIEKSDHHGKWWAHRQEPGPCCISHMQVFANDPESVAAWNRRPSPPSPQGGAMIPEPTPPERPLTHRECGYGPGTYLNKCFACKETFKGAKGAWTCERCAELVAQFCGSYIERAIKAEQRVRDIEATAAPTPSPSAGGNETFEQRTARVIGLLREYDLDYAADHMQAMAKRIPASAGGATELVKEVAEWLPILRYAGAPGGDGSTITPGACIDLAELLTKLAATLTAAQGEIERWKTEARKEGESANEWHNRFSNTNAMLQTERARAEAAEAALTTAREALGRVGIQNTDIDGAPETECLVCGERADGHNQASAIEHEADCVLRALPLISETGRK